MTITAKDGLLYVNGRMAEVHTADAWAQRLGYQYAEQLVRAFAKIESTSVKGLYYWVQSTDPEQLDDNSLSFMVVAQADGFPESEAWDDWFAKVSDARAIAEKLAKGEL